MRTGKDRVQVEATQVPVNIGGARVAPGDMLRGDADGVIVIPKEHEDAVLKAAEEIQRPKKRSGQTVRGGMRACAKRASKHRYHQLQTREAK